ncbi:hypothetical protein FPSE_05419 [Fusarium pseudograminearum CS3096]|uniref:BTB domain-containing protein n=1 Tax=Fusarium pseudograminearum (strain CS3096) TaxID=1028729 RepID=K3VIN4_FUSPC|nr:hypothetical protein FPSE_05419 [Fusarium pseudograminearum CS3096]EKJ74412.1 hypothetical protein FPSE_05419 [Fusarium pseudograminearum CS3096]
MASVVYNIDPNGDLVVVLKDPNTYWVVPEVSVRENPVGSQAGHLLRDTTDVDTPKMPSGLGDSVEAPTEVRFRVSSRHLTLASVVFDKMLNGPWKESASVSTRSSPKDGYTTAPEDDVQDSKDMDEPGPPVDPSTPSPPLIREVSAEGWNAQALLTVLKVIHGQCSGISRDVSLTFIAQVAIIVNYYQCAESVSFATELLYYPKYKKPEVYNKKAIMWLFIAWSFSWPAVFQDTAHQVLQRGQGLSYVTTHDLDVDGILEQLDKKRKSTLDLLRQGLEDINVGGQTGLSPQMQIDDAGVIDAGEKFPS